jgi:predicted site-specific integrase-resolvase
MSNDDQLIGAGDACDLLNIDRSTLIRQVKRGKITAAQKMPGLSGAYLFDREYIQELAALERAIEQRRAMQARAS